MAQRPTFPSPYLCAIDPNVNNDFKCLINDKDVITSYEFKIFGYRITGTIGEAEYTQTGTSTIYGGNGNSSYLVITVPSKELKAGGEYVWRVTLTDNNGAKVTSKLYYFKCVESPKLEITSDDVGANYILTKANATFNATYTCKSELKYHQFILKRDGEIVYDSGEKYSQNFVFSYEGFLNGKYTLTLKVETMDKMTASTEFAFTVKYDTAPMQIYPVCKVNTEDNSVTVDLSNVVTIPGTYYPSDAEYQEIQVDETLKGCYIPKNTTLSWQERTGLSENLDIDEDNHAIYLMVNLPYGKRGNILSLTGDKKVTISFDGYKFTYSRSNGVVRTASITSKEYEFGNQKATYAIQPDRLYEYYFTPDKEYNFGSDYKMIFQTPTTANWWLLTITPSKFTCERGAEFSNV